ncbi:LysM peptidoglycan-binding domain-containing protein [Bacteriovoracaceae bacterium]|nr:LysM peptidoglycan-binding domain-containing protein [Bacteriovoracaceae bacterium]
MEKWISLILILLLITISSDTYAEDSDLEDIDFSQLEKDDDLLSMKNDLGVNLDFLEDDFDEKYYSDQVDNLKSKDKRPDKISGEIVNNGEKKKSKTFLKTFDIGEEEQDLLKLAKYVEKKIPETDWNEIAAAAKTDEYVIAEGEYLWKISQNLFGTGFYYSKIWSLNPYITNPHEITPGMVLSFTTGDTLSLPEVKVGAFDSSEDESKKINFDQLGDNVTPEWIAEKKRLKKQGVYFQYATDKTYDDLKKASEVFRIKEYNKYVPPQEQIRMGLAEQYDSTGFSKDSRLDFDFKEGFSFTTFVTSNIMQDLGVLDSSSAADMYLEKHDKVFVKFNPAVKVLPGDKYSIYSAMGKIKHSRSDRVGHKFAIIAELKAIRKVSHLWECLMTDSVSSVKRGDRLTVHTERIGKIFKTFNSRNIEAIVAGGYTPGKTHYSYGDVIYLDRGRADGVETGNVFELYSFKDGHNRKKITPDPTYKIGEVTVITLTDNFATSLVTLSSNVIKNGTLALSKTKKDAAIVAKLQNKEIDSNLRRLEENALDELDVELELNDTNKSLLKKVDKLELTDEELEELERQEREKSFVQEGEKDLKDLERLEEEIETAQSQLNEANLDRDKLLQSEDLNLLEARASANTKDTFDSMNEIEQKEGKKYLDEDLNSKENPFGLTEFDLEEIDELLNTKSEQTAKK